MLDQDRLILELSASALPVRRTWPPWLRVSLLVPAMLMLGYLAVLPLPRVGGGWVLPSTPLAIANAGLCLLMGWVALAQALATSIAGCSVRAKSWMISVLAIWLCVVAGCIDLSSIPHPRHASHPFCLTFIVLAGLPMIGALIFTLRRTRSLTPARSLAIAGAGIASLAFGLLAFCHPADVSIADFGTHIMAAAILGLLTVALGRRAVAA